jgi:hypothetical protein
MDNFLIIEVIKIIQEQIYPKNVWVEKIREKV